MRCYGVGLVLWLCACGSVSETKVDASCVAESDVDLCSRIDNACESHLVMDSCGMQRTVDCGGCDGGQGCVVGTCKDAGVHVIQLHEHATLAVQPPRPRRLDR